ncbi:hypothetical protein [Albibacterium sp.]|uniref:hypothetical protein n=1 Tax=Albibacterium sp. TaxID=2952885 RepID=UPI002BC7AD3E|nr:hypothetical protein [Albibacterium sp.]HUH19623.1 hypothetical protein [Albibacterium sp.]
MLKLLINSLSKEFYKQHAGLFLIGFYILFGMVDSSQPIVYQQSLLLISLSSPLGMVLVFISWFLYGGKAHFFISQRLKLHQYNFIKETGSLKRNTQLKLWLKLYSVILLPIFIYVILLIIIGLKFKYYNSVISIIVVFLTLFLGLAWLRFHSITFGFLKQESRWLNISLKIKKPFFSWPIFYLFTEQLLMLFVCKIISAILFKGVLWMFADVGNDIKVLLTALLASVICHSILVVNLLKFETEQLSFCRSLPIKTSNKIWNWLLIFTIILIPEWVFFTIAANYNLYIIASGYSFGLSALLFFITILFMMKLNTSSYLKFLLFFFFIVLYIILGNYYIQLTVLMISYSLLFYIFWFNKIDLREVK